MKDLDALAPTGLLKSEHFLHLRCEVPAADTLGMVEPVIGHRLVRLISLMDHSPGVGQYADLDFYRERRRRRAGGRTRIETSHRRLLEQRARLRRPEPTRAARSRKPPAMWDVPMPATTTAPRTKSRKMPPTESRISEFPVTLTAAKAAKAAGVSAPSSPGLRTSCAAAPIPGMSRYRIGRCACGGCIRLRLRPAQRGGGRVPVRRRASDLPRAMALVQRAPGAAWRA